MHILVQYPSGGGSLVLCIVFPWVTGLKAPTNPISQDSDSCQYLSSGYLALKQAFTVYNYYMTTVHSLNSIRSEFNRKKNFHFDLSDITLTLKVDQSIKSRMKE